jgi:hypothetical protein
LTLLKGIVAGLVLANVSYFLWSRGIASTPEATALATPSLQLASEARGGQPPGAEAPSGLPPGAATPSDTEPAGATPSGAGWAAPTAPGVAPPADSTIKASSEPPAAPAESKGAAVDTPKRCISVGPFREVSEAARAAGTLRSSGYDPRQRVADGEVWAGVWVYLPVPPAPAAADQLLDKLKAGGIDDAMEMPGPNDTSVISLGLFSEPKRAQARVAQAQALSLNAAVTDRKRNGNVYWIDIDLKPTEPMLNPADVQGESGRIMRLEVKACPAASGQR